MKKRFSIKNIHIAIIITGIIFVCIGVFHSNLWFDEAYSVGMANKSFVDIWEIGSHDVHPVLYYWILHIIYLITNGSIMAYRIFSAICISILGVLGFTHIRKDFGEKTGLLFSFFAYFMPVMCAYAEEIRMYSLAIVLVTVLAIYAYRLANQEEKNSKIGLDKNWIIFGLTSLACIYVHYYGLMAAGIINVILLVYLIKEKRKNSIIKILLLGLIQLIAYIPWIMCLLTQMKQVSGGFWISFEFPKTLIELSSSQFIGNMENKVGLVVALILYAYLIFRAVRTIKSKEDCKPGIWAFAVYMAVILAAIVVTRILKTSILYYRYLFVITGLYIFFISFFLGKEKNKYIVCSVCLITLILGIWSNTIQIKAAYDKSNMTQISYLKENVQQGDIFTFEETSFGSGSVIALNYTDHKQFFYNPSNWGVEEAYKAFGNQLEIYVDDSFLDLLSGRIWIVDNENSDYYNKLFNNENFKLISQKTIKTKYENYVYNFILVERVEFIDSPDINENVEITDSTGNNTATISDYTGITESYETEQIIEDLKIKYVPASDMIILTDSEIEQYMGEGYSDLYEIVSMDSQGKKLLYVFKVANDENDYTTDEYIKNSLNGLDYSEITKETIAGIEFSKAQLSYEEDGDSYTEECYVYKYDNIFLCLDYWHSNDVKNELTQMFEKVE